MLEFLLVIAFTAHLIAVNIAATAPLFCVALDWLAARPDDQKIAAIGRRLANISLAAFAVGIALGGALLAIHWYSNPSYWSAIRRVPIYRWWFFGGELLFYLVCMIPYVMLWNRAAGTHVAASLRDANASLGETRPRGRWWHRLLAVLASTNVLYHFPPFFTMLSLMSTRPELANAALDRSLHVELFTDPETLARVAHHWLSSLTTAAVALMLLAARYGAEAPADNRDASSNRAMTFAARSALVATTLQLPTGLWLLLASPTRAQSQLLGGDATSTAIFVTAIVTMVVLLQQLATAAFGDNSKATAVKSALLLSIVLLLMSVVLHRTRASAGPAGFLRRPSLTVEISLFSRLPVAAGLDLARGVCFHS